MPQTTFPKNPTSRLGDNTQDGHVDNLEQLLEALKTIDVSPLWAQMQRLNPPAPNPTTVPFVWDYGKIRPYLVKAGELVTEDQAERRVLMLVNPARGNYCKTAIGISFLFLDNSRSFQRPVADCLCHRCPFHNRHPLRRTSARQTGRDSICTPPHRFRSTIHYRGPWWFHRSSRQACANAVSRRDRDADLELSRSR